MKNFILQLFEKPAFTAILGAIISGIASIVIVIIKNKQENKKFIYEYIFKKTQETYRLVITQLFVFSDVIFMFQFSDKSTRRTQFILESSKFINFLYTQFIYLDEKTKDKLIEIIKELIYFRDNQIISDDNMKELWRSFTTKVIATIKHIEYYSGIELTHKFINRMTKPKRQRKTH